MERKGKICNLLSSYLQEERDAGRFGIVLAVVPHLAAGLVPWGTATFLPPEPSAGVRLLSDTINSTS